MKSTFLYGGHVRANGIRQHFLRYGGRGQAMVVVPGIISPAILWGFVGEQLGRDFDAYVLDVRGRGLSEAGAHLDYGLDSCADDVIAFAAELSLDRYVLLGHSMGARIGVRAARRAGSFDIGRMERLVLVDPPVSGPGRRPYPSPLANMLSLLQAAKRGKVDDVLRQDKSRTWPEPLLRIRAEWLHTCDERAVIASYQAFHDNDMFSDLPCISIPVALIAAGRGDVIRPSDEAEMRSKLPGMEAVRVPNAGHQIPVDDFEGFFQALESVLHLTLTKRGQA